MPDRKGILDAFLDVLPAKRKRAANGWWGFDCPECGDTRGRGGFLELGNGGWRYSCFNSGCAFASQPTGWEPGSGLGGRPRKLFVLLGGDLRTLPLRDLMRESNRYDRKGNRVSVGRGELARSFDPVELPEGSVSLSGPVPSELAGHPGFRAVVAYLWSRGEHVATSHEYFWSPKRASYLVIPYLHHGRTVGWLGRAAVDGPARFIGKCPPDYIFNQDRLELDQGRASIVVEGVMDAIALGCQAVRNSRPTDRQRALLRLTGHDVIVLPDQESGGLALVEAAEREGWRVSVPGWDAGVKDVCQAVGRYGLLYATETIVAGATHNYMRARMSLRLKELG